MNKQDKSKLIASYTQYRKKKIGKKDTLHFLRNFMPEIIFRTTRLEGESVTRRMVSLLFK
ncbi:hypothetical protein BH11PAT1_BH11PAT1_5220 [soil metagenome]